MTRLEKSWMFKKTF